MSGDVGKTAADRGTVHRRWAVVTGLVGIVLWQMGETVSAVCFFISCALAIFNVWFSTRTRPALSEPAPLAGSSVGEVREVVITLYGGGQVRGYLRQCTINRALYAIAHDIRGAILLTNVGGNLETISVRNIHTISVVR